MDHNPFLKSQGKLPDPQRAVRGVVEPPADIENITWQTRPKPPTPYENALCDHLEQIFAAGTVELSGIVAGLNQAGFRSPCGEAWTEQTFTQTLAELGR